MEPFSLFPSIIIQVSFCYNDILIYYDIADDTDDLK